MYLQVMSISIKNNYKCMWWIDIEKMNKLFKNLLRFNEINVCKNKELINMLSSVLYPIFQKKKKW